MRSFRATSSASSPNSSTTFAFYSRHARLERLTRAQVGQLLAIHAYHAPKRFKAFLEQEELTGQIVAALLGGNSVEGKLIHARTLGRIVADLENARAAREWLRETRRAVSDRFKGIGQGTGSSRTPSSSSRRTSSSSPRYFALGHPT